ncbi:unknown [Gryllus bimaculatus nudivirus]|uniref:Uncharacterized protein n=1 Tax=Gryllus bimaculatus nudivirus TaxID=432587 RepID=A4L244_9VIRU|nr:hypothetical protein GrBNV_gp81 [Gryllus bimaculatus nudivirus]ABO45414.1 unknown [Gryllus bimaculatus nudivirus]
MSIITVDSNILGFPLLVKDRLNSFTNIKTKQWCRKINECLNISQEDNKNTIYFNSPLTYSNDENILNELGKVMISFVYFKNDNTDFDTILKLQEKKINTMFLICDDFKNYKPTQIPNRKYLYLLPHTCDLKTVADFVALIVYIFVKNDNKLPDLSVFKRIFKSNDYSTSLVGTSCCNQDVLCNLYDFTLSSYMKSRNLKVGKDEPLLFKDSFNNSSKQRKKDREYFEITI